METLREFERDLGEMREYYSQGKTKAASWRKSQLKGLLTLLKEKEGDILNALMQDLGKHQVETFRDEVHKLYILFHFNFLSVHIYGLPSKK